MLIQVVLIITFLRLKKMKALKVVVILYKTNKNNVSDN